MKERILIMVAHSDDQIVGAGGTIAKYCDEGSKVKVVIFSSGEKSVPWLKEEVIKRKRIKESQKVSRVLKCEVKFLGLPDLRLGENIEDATKKAEEIIKKFKPNKIFTHNKYDTHPDHRAVYEVVTKALKGRKPQIFTFLVWNLFNPKDSAVFYVNIDDFFDDKIMALKEFKTQRLILWLFYLPIYIKNRLAGIKNRCKYAEIFYVENA